MSKELTSSQAAKQLGVDARLLRLWCQQGRFPNAYTKEESRGPVWIIPESDLNDFEPPKMGRPRKVAEEGAPKKPAGKRARANA